MSFVDSFSLFFVEYFCFSIVDFLVFILFIISLAGLVDIKMVYKFDQCFLLEIFLFFLFKDNEVNGDGFFFAVICLNFMLV